MPPGRGLEATRQISACFINSQKVKNFDYFNEGTHILGPKVKIQMHICISFKRVQNNSAIPHCAFCIETEWMRV